MQETIARLPPIVLVLAFLAFWGWEGLGAARPQSADRGRRWRNIGISCVSFAMAGAAGGALLALPSLAGGSSWGIARAAPLQGWPGTVLGIILLDLADYWRHRISHAVPLLWRLHRLHHSDPVVDVTTSLRSHPIELALRPAFLAVAVVAFGIPPMSLLLYPVLQLPVLVFQHANIQLPPRLDRALAWLVPTPAMHLVHHSRLPAQTDSNYATFLSVWDRLFGSFQPSRAPRALGLDGLDSERDQSLLGMLRQPWRRMPGLG
jgi:sterol desaturase/sphingolipid hydroxylase (fatty acid hydroxylase superfamily)